MPTTDELKAAPRSTVVEPGAWPGRTPMWELYHYEHGKQTGVSIAVHKDLHTWLRDLEAAGSLIGFGWEIRGQDAPADWPGWPIEPDQDGNPVYPMPGAEIPDMPGFVVGTCTHRVAASEWRAGFRTCERCPSAEWDEDEQDGESNG